MQFGQQLRNMGLGFQPIVDTARSRVFAYQCAQTVAVAEGNVGSAAPLPQPGGPVFVQACEVETQSFMRRIMPRLRDVVYQFRLWGPLQELPDLTKAREARRGVRLSLALEVSEAEDDTVHAIERLRPEYIKMSSVIARNVEQPACAHAVRRLTSLAEKRGMILIAEGVQHLETVENLWLLGVRNMQGSYFSDPESIFQNAQSRLVKPVCARKF